MENLCHGAAGDIGTLLGQAAIMEVFSGMLGVSQVHIGNDVHDPAVGFLGQALILAAVAGFHVENGNMQPLGGDGRNRGWAYRTFLPWH